MIGKKTGTGDQRLTARMAHSICSPGNITQVDIFDTGTVSDITELMQGFQGSWRNMLHFVGREKPADMPGGICSQLPDYEISHFGSFSRIVIDIRYDQRGHFQPDALLFQYFQIFEYRLELCSRISPIGPIPETLHIYIGRIQQRIKPVQHFPGHESVGDEDIRQTIIAGLTGDFPGVLEKNGRLIVGIRNVPAVVLKGTGDDLAGRSGMTGGYRSAGGRRFSGDGLRFGGFVPLMGVMPAGGFLGVAEDLPGAGVFLGTGFFHQLGPLCDLEVLAPWAPEIASHRTHGIGP